MSAQSVDVSPGLRKGIGTTENNPKSVHPGPAGCRFVSEMQTGKSKAKHRKIQLVKSIALFSKDNEEHDTQRLKHVKQSEVAALSTAQPDPQEVLLTMATQVNVQRSSFYGVLGGK